MVWCCAIGASRRVGSSCRGSGALCLSFFFSSRRRHTRCLSDWSSDVCSSDLGHATTYRALLRGLGALGHRVSFLERNVPWYAEHRDLLKPAGCEVALYDSLDELRSEERRVGKECRARWAQY